MLWTRIRPRLTIFAKSTSERKDDKSAEMNNPLPFHSIHRHGLVRVAAATPAVFVADPAANARAVLELAQQAERDGVDLVVFPELCLTAYAIDDLLTQQALLDATRTALASIVTASERMRAVLVVGLVGAVTWAHRNETPSGERVATEPAPDATTSPHLGWTSLPPVPGDGRDSGVAVWTGEEIIVVGGTSTAGCLPPVLCDISLDPLASGAAKLNA